VNAGSNTITVFSVYGDRLVRRQVISSGGTFPVSVAFHGSLVYVLNARDGGSVQGFLRIGPTLVRVPSWNRPLGLDPALTPEFTYTPGQVAFTPDGSRLIVTTKGSGNDIDVFTVGFSGGLSAAPGGHRGPGQCPVRHHLRRRRSPGSRRGRGQRGRHVHCQPGDILCG
jgi:DNA-binding beta-propeller fold protein YncE